MADNLFNTVYNPDVLSCLANLSNDEVFTPPDVVNKMLDMLPQELFRNPDTTFLDPACKTGVFLREIAKRLITGLEPQMPDLQERIDHIFHKQLYAIAITELTSLLSRRSVYCSKYPQSEFSITQFDDAEGNIRYRKVQHKWKDGKCVYCGISNKTELGKDERGDTLEAYAYEWIHTMMPEEIFNMKFDVIISNPPYQLNVGIEKENYAVPIYQKFVNQAIKLQPRYLSMIIPARWYAGGRGLDNFRDQTLNDKRYKVLHDYYNATDCFPGVDIAGGVCFFLWEKDYQGDCTVINHKANNITSTSHRPLLESGMTSFIRQNDAISILKKVRRYNENTFDKIVSPQTPFGLISSFRDFKNEPFQGSVKYYTFGHVGYIDKCLISKNKEMVTPHKVYISAAYGERGSFPYFFLGKPFYGEPNSCCSQSYLVIGPFDNKEKCQNVMSYISTKFFRTMIMLKKNAQHNMSYVFECVPLQDFTKPWTDEELYAKYGITDDEIAFIDTMIRPMDLSGGDKDAD